ncbi:MAG TPA: alkaline phosphatase family protein [Steroidobacteraceae bacterium]
MRDWRSWQRHSCALGSAVVLLMALLPLSTARPALAAMPRIGHVFILMLENEGYERTFGPKSRAMYLTHLAARGALLKNYYATSHFSLGNYITLISGQAANAATDNDCPRYEEFIQSGTAPDGQAIGAGCVYPANIPTIAQQLEARHLRWKAYMEDMGNAPDRESAQCGHPPLGAPDNTQAAQAGDQYATRHNPFMYFHAIIDSPSCGEHVVNMSALEPDLKSLVATPSYVFITPNLCHDGHDGGNMGRCVNGEPGGLESADQFLRQVVPRILASPAFRLDGLLIITFDEADLEYDFDSATRTVHINSGDAAACCNEPPGPNIPAYQPLRTGGSAGINGPGLIGPGGGRIGAVLLSPYIRPGTLSSVPYNHYSLLRSVEDIYSLTYLGYADQPELKSFGPDVFARPQRARGGCSASADWPSAGLSAAPPPNCDANHTGAPPAN